MSTQPPLKHSPLCPCPKCVKSPTHWLESEAVRSIINPEAAVTGAFGNCVKCGKPFFDPNESVYHFPRGPMCGTCFIPPTPAPTLAETGAAFIAAIKRKAEAMAGLSPEAKQAKLDEASEWLQRAHIAHHAMWEHVHPEEKG